MNISATRRTWRCVSGVAKATLGVHGCTGGAAAAVSSGGVLAAGSAADAAAAAAAALPRGFAAPLPVRFGTRARCALAGAASAAALPVQRSAEQLQQRGLAWKGR